MSTSVSVGWSILKECGTNVSEDVMEKAHEYCSPLYMCFIDLEKAYDSVDGTALWEVLQCMNGLPRKLISIILSFHDSSSAAVRAYGKVSEEFVVMT